jgi:hypothetical protein
MTAAQAVTRALEDAADSGPNFNIGTFWMSLDEYGYEVVPKPVLLCKNCGKPMADHDDMAHCWVQAVGTQSDGTVCASDP